MKHSPRPPKVPPTTVTTATTTTTTTTTSASGTSRDLLDLTFTTASSLGGVYSVTRSGGTTTFTPTGTRPTPFAPPASSTFTLDPKAKPPSMGPTKPTKASVNFMLGMRDEETGTIWDDTIQTQYDELRAAYQDRSARGGMTDAEIEAYVNLTEIAGRLRAGALTRKLAAANKGKTSSKIYSWIFRRLLQTPHLQGPYLSPWQRRRRGRRI